MTLHQAITCPWCGTSYTTHRENCKNCGGPLPPPPAVTAGPRRVELSEPPPAPRAFKDNFIWRQLGSDGWSIVAGIFLLLGVIFTLVGLPLLLVVVGLVFVPMGLVFLGISVPVLIWRYRQAEQTLKVLRTGQAVLATIDDVTQNYNVQVNGRNPWTVVYRFQVDGQTYQGQTTTLRPVGFTHQPGQPVYVLYLEEDPAVNTIYPPVM